MLTNLVVRNFKYLEEVEVELGQTVVFVGPNNSGKTTALQALALWEIGLRRWNEKRAGKPTQENRPGVAINRRDLIAVPVPNANLLWRDLHVRDVHYVGGKAVGRRNVRIDIMVSGVADGSGWQCGLEFDYANEESFYCRPLRLSEEETPERMAIPEAAKAVRMAFMPPMSGLAASETRLDLGAINVRLGEGRTGEMLRNLCFLIYSQEDKRLWEELVRQIKHLFLVDLDPPQYIAERGEVTMTYREPSGIRLDLSSSGRGLQQTLLLLAHLYGNPRTVLLLDEPDAHLEIFRQRQAYQLLTEVADAHGSQAIIASHSEVILNEAADRDVVVAFVGRPHRIDDRGSQVLKALKEIGFDQYYQAEQAGWVLYLEGSTDLAILRAFAEALGHPAGSFLERPFVHYVGKELLRARDHFHGLLEAKSDLQGIAIFDRLAKSLDAKGPLVEMAWERREVENYLCFPETLMAYARALGAQASAGPLFAPGFVARAENAMSEAIEEVQKALATLGKPGAFSADVKASDDFMDPLFREFFRKLKLPNLMQKSDYHVLARLVPRELIPDEVSRKLDAIVEVARKAKSAAGGG
ncbi:MAG: AAA family ATPase [Planctomycetes bacterium]|nr:AAA family ATPase [Planctomycetota bacterium]